MSNLLANVSHLPLDEQLSYWQRANQLEAGRTEVLRMVASGEPLQEILQILCEKAKVYSPDMLCSVLSYNDEQQTLHPMASSSLPDFYCQALEGVVAGLGVGSCGTAAFTKQRVIVEDINTHPYWAQYKGLALEAGLQACWSEPIIGRDGKVHGTFAMYYRFPNKPSKVDLQFIELSANLAAIIFDNDLNHQKLLDANKKLSMTVDERTVELENANAHLAKLIDEKEKQHKQQINAEKRLTTNALLCGFAHEISTPIGKALMAITSIQEHIQALSQQVAAGKVTRTKFENYLHTLNTLVELNTSSLDTAENLLRQFQSIDINKADTETEHFKIDTFMEDVASSVQALLGRHQLLFDVDVDEVSCNKESLWQVLYQLIENSVVHGFQGKENGMIHISAMIKADELVINYQDDGVGIASDSQTKIFEPFYTTQRTRNSVGLGLSTVTNLLANVLNGTIQLKPSPTGLRFEITIPVTG